jgi:hypothetical protein
MMKWRVFAASEKFNQSDPELCDKVISELAANFWIPKFLTEKVSLH